MPVKCDSDDSDCEVQGVTGPTVKEEPNTSEQRQHLLDLMKRVQQFNSGGLRPNVPLVTNPKPLILNGPIKVESKVSQQEVRHVIIDKPKEYKRPTSYASHAFSLGNFPASYYNFTPFAMTRIGCRKQPPLPM